MTGAQICVEARRFNPKIQLRDVWFVLLQMQRRGLTVCLNPTQVTGRLYSLTDSGHAAVASAFSITLPGIAADVDWKKYSFVVRGKVRRMTLQTLASLVNLTGEPQTATRIRQRLNAVGFNQVMRAIKELKSAGLIQQAGVTDERCLKLYRVTPAAHKILASMK